MLDTEIHGNVAYWQQDGKMRGTHQTGRICCLRVLYKRLRRQDFKTGHFRLRECWHRRTGAVLVPVGLENLRNGQGRLRGFGRGWAQARKNCWQVPCVIPREQQATGILALAVPATAVLIPAGIHQRGWRKDKSATPEIEESSAF